MRVSGGYIIVPSSLQVALPERPKDLGIDGPVISASRMAVLRPDWRALTARSEVTSDFPTPTLPLTTAITFFTFLLLSFLEFCGAVLSLQSEPQLEQLCEHASLIR